MKLKLLATCVGLAQIAWSTHAMALAFTDNFTPSASPVWSNSLGNWTASGGAYYAQVPNNNPLANTLLPYDFTNSNLSITVTVNGEGDGGIFVDAQDYTSGPMKGQVENGVVLVLGGGGYGQGEQSFPAGTEIYYHVISNGSLSGEMDVIPGIFTPGGTYTITLDVNGDTYSAYVNGVLTDTLTSTVYASGQVGLYDNQPNTITGSGSGTPTTFSDFSVSGTLATTPLPAAFPLFASGLGALGLLGWRRKRKAQAAAA